MEVSRTADDALRNMRRIWFAFTVSVALIVWIGETMPGISWLSFSHSEGTFVILSVFYLIIFSLIRWKRYSYDLVATRNRPEDSHNVKRWEISWVGLISAAEAQTLCGFALRTGGKTLQQSLPFYVLGIVLIFSLWPRRVWSTPA